MGVNRIGTHIPKGDPAKGEVLCHSPSSDPLKNPCKLLPVAFAIDRKEIIWVTNIFGHHVTRFPAADPTKFETFKTSFSGSGFAIDSLGMSGSLTSSAIPSAAV